MGLGRAPNRKHAFRVPISSFALKVRGNFDASFCRLPNSDDTSRFELDGVETCRRDKCSIPFHYFGVSQFRSWQASPLILFWAVGASLLPGYLVQAEYRTNTGGIVKPRRTELTHP
jgi:hypothetical protein